MKRAILAVAVLALAACGESAADDAPVAEDTAAVDSVDVAANGGFEAVAPGNYEVAHQDGSVDQLTISPGMLWSMVFANGDAAGGTIFAQDGENCFVTEGVEGHQCFKGGEPAEDGSMQVTAADGEVMAVSPVVAASE